MFLRCPNPAVRVCVCLTPYSTTSFASLALLPCLQISHWSRCRSHHCPLLPLSPRRRVNGDVAAKRGADGVMKGQRGCLGLISALVLATADSMYAVSVSGISHQFRPQKVCKHTVSDHLHLRFPQFLLVLMTIGISIKICNPAFSTSVNTGRVIAAFMF